jgi:hypothetical protein
VAGLVQRCGLVCGVGGRGGGGGPYGEAAWRVREGGEECGERGRGAVRAIMWEEWGTGA